MNVLGRTLKMENKSEEIKEFWEWCGVRPTIGRVPDIDGTCYVSNNVYPDIDLNNLFKYAVIRLKDFKLYKDALGGWVSVADYEHNGYSKDPALALYSAIQEVIKCQKK